MLLSSPQIWRGLDRLFQFLALDFQHNNASGSRGMQHAPPIARTTSRPMRQCLLAVIAATMTLSALAVPPEDSDDDLTALWARGRIVLGVQTASLPFAYQARSSERPIGFSVDLCLKVIERLRSDARARHRGSPGTLSVDYRPVTSKNRIPMLLTGSIDLECGSTTATSARKALGGEGPWGVAFSRMIFWSDVAAAVPKHRTAPTFRLVEHLPALTAERPLVTTSGSTSVRHLEVLEETLRQPIRRQFAPSHAEAFAQLDRGDASAFVMDRVLLKGRLDPRRYRLLEGRISSDQGESYGLMMRRSDRQLQKVVDATLGELMRSGEFESLYRRWFLAPIPAPTWASANSAQAPALHPAISLPMSDELRQALRLPVPAERNPR